MKMKFVLYFPKYILKVKNASYFLLPSDSSYDIHNLQKIRGQDHATVFVLIHSAKLL